MHHPSRSGPSKKLGWSEGQSPESERGTQQMGTHDDTGNKAETARELGGTRDDFDPFDDDYTDTFRRIL